MQQFTHNIAWLQTSKQSHTDNQKQYLTSLLQQGKNIHFVEPTERVASGWLLLSQGSDQFDKFLSH